MILAISDIVWQAMISALVTIVLGGLQVWLKISMQAAADRASLAAETAAKKVDIVKNTLVETTAITGDKLDDVATKIEEVHKATNSLADRLVAKTEQEALARGASEERGRAAAAAAQKKVEG